MLERRRRFRWLVAVGVVAVAVVALLPGTAAAAPPDCSDTTVKAEEGSVAAVVITLECTGAVVDDLRLDPDPASPAPQFGQVLFSTIDPADPELIATYTPDPDEPVHDDSFVFQAGSAGEWSDPRTVTIEVPPAPVCADISTATVFRSLTTITLSCTGTIEHMVVKALPTYGVLTDPDGHSVTTDTDLALTTAPDGSSATVQYAPGWSFAGTDQFEFAASNGPSKSAVARTTIEVIGAPPAGGGGGASDLPTFEFADPGADFASQVVSAPSGPRPTFHPIATAGNTRYGNIPRFGRSMRVAGPRGKIRATRTGAVKLSLRNTNQFAVRAKLSVRASKQRLTLGPRSVTLKPRARVTVTLRLNHGERALLKRLRTAKMVASLTAKDGVGIARTARSRFTLRGPR
jgi:hypothetical protein